MKARDRKPSAFVVSRLVLSFFTFALCKPSLYTSEIQQCLLLDGISAPEIVIGEGVSKISAASSIAYLRKCGYI